jgi:hypothetical protein
MPIFYYSPCVFFIKVFMSSLRSVDIVPLRGIIATSRIPSEAELGAANRSQLPHAFIV